MSFFNAIYQPMIIGSAKSNVSLSRAIFQPMVIGSNFSIDPNMGPSVPRITSPLARNATINRAFSYTITARGNPAPTFSASNLPTWATFSGRVISGTPTVLDPVGHSIDLTATNTEGTDTKTLVVKVVEAAGPGPGPTPTPPWEVTFEFSNSVVNVNGLNIGGVVFPPNGRIPLVEWTGWQASFGVDMSDDLYNATSQATLPVQLYSHYAPYTAGTEVQVPFDNWGPHGGTSNEVHEWGYVSATNSITVKGGNTSGNPIRLRLEKA